MTDGNGRIPLSLEEDIDGNMPGEIDIEADFDSSSTPESWIWFMFNSEDEPWFKLTYNEAVQVRNRLNYLLQNYERITAAANSEVDLLI